MLLNMLNKSQNRVLMIRLFCNKADEPENNGVITVRESQHYAPKVEPQAHSSLAFRPFHFRLTASGDSQ